MLQRQQQPIESHNRKVHQQPPISQHVATPCHVFNGQIQCKEEKKNDVQNLEGSTSVRIFCNKVESCNAHHQGIENYKPDIYPLIATVSYNFLTVMLE
eukprot:scaffold147378_cov51-Attheya_sp.AAC.1